MKRIISLALIAFMIVLNSCASNVNAEILQKLKTDYPDAKISISGNLLEVVTDNVDTTGIPKIRCDGGDPLIYFSAESLLDSLDPETDVIFIGKKTGETRQYIPFDSKTGALDGRFYTDSKIRVKKACFGNISAGDVISYREDFAVFHDGEQPQLMYVDLFPVGENEYLYLLHRMDDWKSLFGDDRYYQTRSHIGNVDLETYSKTDFSTSQTRDERIRAELYNKYVVNLTE